MNSAQWLPLAFLALLGASMLAYVILDGYDLGVGILLRLASDADKDIMIASIGPFWDANETWLVLGVGLLLVAFPSAHGVILTALYLPVTIMLFGLILRGVAFDFRVKARASHQPRWNLLFFLGSVMAAFSQGVMLGRFVTGFTPGAAAWAFACAVGLGLLAGYALLGASWLIMKTSGPLQRLATRWARRALLFTAAGVLLISLATPLVSSRIFDKWFTLPAMLWLSPVPLLTLALFASCLRSLRQLPSRQARGDDRGCWLPFATTAAIFVLAFLGLAYSIFPYLVVDRITIWQAASAPESLQVILIGACVVLPVIVAYSVYAYRVFWGKAQILGTD